METNEYTLAERVFRIWMLICALMFGFAMLFFLFAGAWIVPAVNAVAKALFPLPLYPVPATGFEGAFWRVLGVSMMAMLTWACTVVYLDIRRHGWIVWVMIISKFCSTTCYLGFFVVHHQFAYLLGSLTDGPIFLFTLITWYMASPGGRALDGKEEQILSTLGETVVPRGGSFHCGYADFRARCLNEANLLLSGLDPVSRAGVRLMLRILNVTPVLAQGRLRTFLRMPAHDRELFLARAEERGSGLTKTILILVKVLIIGPFFGQPEAARAVGYQEDAEVK